MIRIVPFLCLTLTLPLAAQSGMASGAARVDPLFAQKQIAASSAAVANLPPETLQLLELDQHFSKDVEKRGGIAFRDWIALDGVVLNNGKAAILGFTSITAQANWDPKQYQLSWSTEGAQMGPSKDMGFTWGRYVSHAKEKDGKSTETSGRYITVWKKIENGKWKVAMEASADDAPPVGTSNQPAP
jgi:ketosteroid isomerase-like protein